ncbi:hypothetical protein NDU88_012120 [Pleurodeles waltl]|uniref:Uncharacterized protein n=1 Tax=Pleurodeles waltl TaxID=8319 RepID=A0AAV7R201_PLEWA|nr:hypothetical protein NDU88_012120 [Pleurodeles waltl]
MSQEPCIRGNGWVLNGSGWIPHDPLLSSHSSTLQLRCFLFHVATLEKLERLEQQLDGEVNCLGGLRGLLLDQLRMDSAARFLAKALPRVPESISLAKKKISADSVVSSCLLGGSQQEVPQDLCPKRVTIQWDIAEPFAMHSDFDAGEDTCDTVQCLGTQRSQRRCESRKLVLIAQYDIWGSM